MRQYKSIFRIDHATEVYNVVSSKLDYPCCHIKPIIITLSKPISDAEIACAAACQPIVTCPSRDWHVRKQLWIIRSCCPEVYNVVYIMESAILMLFLFIIIYCISLKPFSLDKILDGSDYSKQCYGNSIECVI